MVVTGQLHAPAAFSPGKTHMDTESYCRPGKIAFLVRAVAGKITLNSYHRPRIHKKYSTANFKMVSCTQMKRQQ